MTNLEQLNVATWIFKPILKFMDERGIPKQKILTTIRWTEKDLFTHKDPVDYSILDKVLLYLSETTNNPHIGIDLGLSKNMLSSHLLDYLVHSSDNVYEAIKKIEKYNSLLSNFYVLYLIEEGENVCIRFPAKSKWFIDYPISSRILRDCVTIFIVKLIEELSGAKAYPFKMYFDNNSLIKDPYLFSRKLGFSSETFFSTDFDCLFYTKQSLNSSILTSNQYLQETIETYLIQLSGTNNSANTLKEKIRWQLVGLEEKNFEIDIQYIAKLNFLSVRTLQSLLKKEGTNFRELHNIAKVDIIKKYLSNPFFSIKETAHVLGYSTSNSLSAFFKKVTGITPTEFSTSLDLNNSRES